jgi:hypothetical protein
VLVLNDSGKPIIAGAVRTDARQAHLAISKTGRRLSADGGTFFIHGDRTVRWLGGKSVDKTF